MGQRLVNAPLLFQCKTQVRLNLDAAGIERQRALKIALRGQGITDSSQVQQAAIRARGKIIGLQAQTLLVRCNRTGQIVAAAMEQRGLEMKLRVQRCSPQRMAYLLERSARIPAFAQHARQTKPGRRAIGCMRERKLIAIECLDAFVQREVRVGLRGQCLRIVGHQLGRPFEIRERCAVVAASVERPRALHVRVCKIRPRRERYGRMRCGGGQVTAQIADSCVQALELGMIPRARRAWRRQLNSSGRRSFNAASFGETRATAYMPPAAPLPQPARPNQRPCGRP